MCHALQALCFSISLPQQLSPNAAPEGAGCCQRLHASPAPTAAAHLHAGPQQICLPQALAKMRCWLQAQPNALGNVITLSFLAAVVEDCRHSPSLI